MDLGDFTVEAWFKALSASGTWFRIFDFGKGGPGDFFITPNHGRTGNDIGGGGHFSGGHVDFGHYPTVKEKFPLKMIRFFSLISIQITEVAALSWTLKHYLIQK